MDAALAFDTCFLIHWERERRKGLMGPAHRFLAHYHAAELKISATALGEFSAGFSDKAHPVLRAVATGFEVLEADRETAWEYAMIFRDLKTKAMLIGANDLWIAASALRHQLPLVTVNESEFRRVPGLHVIGY